MQLILDNGTRSHSIDANISVSNKVNDFAGYRVVCDLDWHKIPFALIRFAVVAFNKEYFTSHEEDELKWLLSYDDPTSPEPMEHINLYLLDDDSMLEIQVLTSDEERASFM